MGYSRALLTSELETIFAQAPLAPNSVAHAHVREAHARATGKAPSTSVPEEDASTNKRIPGPDDDCPICYDGMHGIAETLLVFCEECGNALHKECFQQCGSLFSPLFEFSIITLFLRATDGQQWERINLCLVPSSMDCCSARWRG